MTTPGDAWRLECDIPPGLLAAWLGSPAAPAAGYVEIAREGGISWHVRAKTEEDDDDEPR